MYLVGEFNLLDRYLGARFNLLCKCASRPHCDTCRPAHGACARSNIEQRTPTHAHVNKTVEEEKRPEARESGEDGGGGLSDRHGHE